MTIEPEPPDPTAIEPEPEVGADPLFVEPAAPDAPVLFGLPLNRVVAFLGPYLALLSGAIADWLLVHVHLLTSFHVQASTLASALAQIFVFGITVFVVWLGQHKWLDGYQKWAYANVPAAQPVVDVLHLPIDTAVLARQKPPGTYDPAAEAKALDKLDSSTP